MNRFSLPIVLLLLGLLTCPLANAQAVAPPAEAELTSAEDATAATGPALPEGSLDLASAGAAAFAARNWTEAVERYRELLAEDPDNPLARANLGQALYRLGDFDQAASVLEAAVASEPRLVTAWITLGLIRDRQERPYAAISALARAVDMEPDNAAAHHFLGVAMHQNGWGASARVELQRALQINPSYASAHYNLATIYLEERPPALELARRHYFYSLDAGGPRDEDFERRLHTLESPDDESSPQQ